MRENLFRLTWATAPSSRKIKRSLKITFTQSQHGVWGGLVCCELRSHKHFSKNAAASDGVSAKSKVSVLKGRFRRPTLTVNPYQVSCWGDCQRTSIRIDTIKQKFSWQIKTEPAHHVIPTYLSLCTQHPAKVKPPTKRLLKLILPVKHIHRRLRISLTQAGEPPSDVLAE